MENAAITVRDGLLTVDFDGRAITIRPTRGDFFNFSEILLYDTYRLSSLASPVGTVVDLGANIGLFAVAMMDRADRVISVEPVPENRRIAERNLAAGAENVRLLPYAMAARSGLSKTLFVSSTEPSMHSEYASLGHRTSAAAGTIEVESLSLVDLFARESVERCDLLKCDIEGSEYDVLLSAPKDLLERVDRIAMEVHVHLRPGEPDRWPSLRAHLHDAGFQIEVDGNESPAGDLPAAFMAYALRAK